MAYAFLADIVALLHLAIVAFITLGGVLVLRHPKLIWLHLPALLWGVVVEWADWICPLTPLENYLRLHAGQAGHEGGFVEYWVTAILYPQNLTLELRYVLGAVLIALNTAVYGGAIILRRCAKHS